MQPLELPLACLGARGLLPLNVLDDRLQQLDIALDLLRLCVLGSKSLLEDGV